MRELLVDVILWCRGEAWYVVALGRRIVLAGLARRTGAESPWLFTVPCGARTTAQHQNWHFGLVLSFPHRADQDAEQHGTRHAQRDLRSSEARRESHSGV